jgi:hypothetical protein
MRTPHIALLLLTAATLCRDSLAGPDAGAPKVVIPPWVEEAQLPAFDAAPFPVEASAAPKDAEWKDVPAVRVSRVDERITGCRTYRLREWIKVHCERQTAGVRLVAGSREGVSMLVHETDVHEPGVGLGRSFDVVFPVRPGDRRVFEVFEVEDGYEGWWPFSSLVIEERWAEGATGPTVAVLGL